MARKHFYVVIHGRQPGIYQEWFGEEGAAEQVEGVAEAIFKGFETIEEALEWIRGFDRETLQSWPPICSISLIGAHQGKRPRAQRTG